MQMNPFFQLETFDTCVQSKMLFQDFGFLNFSGQSNWSISFRHLVRQWKFLCVLFLLGILRISICCCVFVWLLHPNFGRFQNSCYELEFTRQWMYLGNLLEGHILVDKSSTKQYIIYNQVQFINILQQKHKHSSFNCFQTRYFVFNISRIFVS